MKKTFCALFLLASFQAPAQMIDGTLVLKGGLKTKIWVDGIKTTCKAKVEKVRNLMEEDSYGNPAYKVKLEIKLDGYDRKTRKRVRHDRNYMLNNLFKSGNGSVVKDLDYHSQDGATMLIDRDGRMKKVSFLYGRERITCTF